MQKYVGTCFCGSVEVEVTGEPFYMGYCHCRSCRWWAAAPMIAFALWAPERVRIAKGEEFLGRFMKTVEGDSDRQYCTKCGGHLLNDHPAFGVVDVYPSTVPDVAFKPSCHMNYSDAVLQMRDGLPKYRDYPAELGGSDDRVSE